MTKPGHLFAGATALESFAADGNFGTYFGLVYGACLIFIFIVSLAGPIDRAMFYFKASSAFFSIFTLSTIVGIGYLVADNGLHPQMEIYDTDSKAWYPCYTKPDGNVKPQPIEHFNILFVSTWVMLGVYLIPMILRPWDFLSNFGRYVAGMLTYLAMIPTFISVMSIYSMCNLHDISWGNRPAAADSAQLSIHAKRQAAMLDNYKMFRVNFFCLWALANIIFVVQLESIMDSSDTIALNDGSLNLL